MAIPDIFNQTFHNVDDRLSRMCEESDGKIHSGCTAVTAFLRVEDAEGQQTFLDPAFNSSPVTESRFPPEINEGARSHDSSSESLGESGDDHPERPSEYKKDKKFNSASRIKKAFKSLSGGSVSGVTIPAAPRPASPSHSAHSTKDVTVVVPPAASRRVLYSANAGDARGVLCRGGKAVRLTYDHKGSDKQEAKRITDAGGFVMSGRVNGVLAVTRSLGDSSMKEFVVGAPYTTETELCDEDEFLILACDGLWDVMGDQAAIDLVRDVDDAQQASQKLLKHALSHHTTDNVTILVVRFKNMMPRTA
jgi:protein phosphatase PTC1